MKMVRLQAMIAVSLILTLALSVKTEAASSACENYDKQISDARSSLRAKQTGGWDDPSVKNKNYVNPDVTKIKDLTDKAIKAGCNLGPQFAPMKLESGQGDLISSQQVPSTPGDKNGVEDPTYNMDFNLPFLDPSKVTSTAASAPFQTPTFNTPYKDKVNESAGCGQLASDYGDYLKNLQGKDKPAYKEGCAGTGANGAPQTTPGSTADSCKGNEISKFGLIQAAYNNSKQSVDVSSLLGATPGTVKADSTIAYKDTKTGSNNEVNGCRLSSYSSCGKAGDIIMVQTNPNVGSSAPFDTYLIYAGNGSFYEVTNTSQVIKNGPLDPAYNSMSYAAIRMGCAAKTTTASGGK